jgi:small conductance mechanosensitive channel
MEFEHCCGELEMEEELAKFKEMGDVIATQGQEVVLALVVLIAGLIASKMLVRLFRRTLDKLPVKPAVVATMSNVFYVVLIMLATAMALNYVGIQAIIIRHILSAVILAAVALIVIFRPLLPTLPFKVGNTIMTGDLLGRVEATTFINTRVRTFDGKTVFVPNSKILNDYLINYHFTPSRRFNLDVGIGYDQDLIKAKQVLEAILVEDPRVMKTPRPVVYVMNLKDSCVELSARGWVPNLKYWQTRCDLLEKAKLRLDQEGIKIAFPQRDVHLYQGAAAPGFPEGGYEISEKGTTS